MSGDKAGPSETVPQGQNVLALGFALAQSNTKQGSTSRLIFRSGTERLNESYIARTEGNALPAGATGNVTGGNLTPGPIIWQSPAQLAKVRSGRVDNETFAYVVADNEDQFLFNRVGNRVNIRTRLAGAETWGTSTRVPGLESLELGHTTVAAVWIGGKDQIILLYTWQADVGLIESVGTRQADKSYKFVPTKEPVIPKAPGCKKLAVINTSNGLYLVSLDNEILVLRNKPPGGKWGAAVSLVPKGKVYPFSPSTIVPIPKENAAVHAGDLIPPDAKPNVVPCYPEPEDTRPPLIPFTKDRDAELGVAYIDTNFTVQVQRFTYPGKAIGDPTRISRLNPPFINDQRILRGLTITRGRHPRARSVYGISSLHQTKTLLSLDEEAELDRYTYAAATREAFHQALKQLAWLLQLRNTSAAELIAAQKLVREQFDGVVHVKNVQNRDYWELKYLLARSRWHEAFLVAREAQNRAIAAYNALIEADLQVKVNPVKTEAHTLVNGVPTLPPIPNLPVE